MSIHGLFGEFGLDRFITEHLHRLPLALPEVGQIICEYASWNALGILLAAPSIDGMVVKSGQRQNGPLPTTLETADALCRDGCTITLRHVERNDEKIAELANAFERTFHGPVDVHFFATPPGSFGFSWHYDAEDVFIYQTRGTKEYFLRKNTVNPWPLEETLPGDMRYERESMPLMRVVLQPGDMLYIPCGYWHRARVPPGDEIAVSLAIGVMSRSAIDLLAMLRDEMLQSLVWRQRLPLLAGDVYDSPESVATVQFLLANLASDISRTLTGPVFLKRVVQSLTDKGIEVEGVLPTAVAATDKLGT
jgi:50S ribosomal protein L16 3-hydroxylase